jgi:hydroxyacylglutathione hydrolase
MSEKDDLIVEAIVNGPIQGNCYLVGEAQSGKAWLIDPGDEAERILERARRRGLKVERILCTHGHIDHAGAVASLKRTLGVPFSLHPADRPWLDHLPSQAEMFGLPSVEIPEVDDELTDGQQLQLGALSATVLFTPGHSAGGCCVHFPSHHLVFVGDTLFEGSIGRSDLPGGSLPTLLASIRDKLLVLEDDVIVYSGHGPRTTIGAERAGNPFLRPGAVMLD